MTTMRRSFVMILCFALLSCVAWGQKASASKGSKAAANAVLGKWSGVAKGTGQGDLAFTMELRSEGDKIVGSITSAQGTMAISNGSFAAGKLTMTFSSPQSPTGKITGTVKANKLVGQWTLGDEAGTFEATRAGN